MVYNRIRHKHAFPASKLGSKTQIHVFVIQKEILVQETNLVNHLAPIHCTRSASRKDRFQ